MGNRTSNKNIKTNEWLTLYNSGLTYRNIAEIYQVPLSKVYSAVSPHVRSRQRKLSSDRIAEYLELRKQGLTCNQIGSKYGVTGQAVSNAIAP